MQEITGAGTSLHNQYKSFRDCTAVKGGEKNKKNPAPDKCVKRVVWQLLVVVIAVVANKLRVSI